MDYWCYAIINRRLGEIFFTRKNNEPIIEGHCYLGKDEKFTKTEANVLQHDIIHNQFAYYRRQYRHID
jgi:hypothetical protein